MERVNHFLPTPLIKALRVKAKRLDTSVAELIRRGMEAWLEQGWLMPSINDLRKTTAEKRQDAIDHARMLIAWHKGEYGD